MIRRLFLLFTLGVFAVGPVAAASDWVFAVQTNQTDLLSQMLPAQRSGGDLDEPASDGKTAVMAAAARGDASLLTRLIDAGANPRAINYKGASALMYGAWSGDPTVVELLIEQKVPLEKAASNGWTAMTMAAAKNSAQVIDLLVKAGAKTDPPDVYGWTPLMRASNLNKVDSVKMLIRHKASLSRINASGQTALHVAATAGHRQIYELLLAAGADPAVKDFNGKSAQTIADEKFSTHQT